jgi:putative membrane protein
MLFALARRLLTLLCVIFCIAYPIALVGITFNVQPSFSLTWAGSALLLLEGGMLILAALLAYGFTQTVCANLVVIVLSTLAEHIGVSTGFPFGTYVYTNILQPHITTLVPLAVPFAWILVILGAYGLLRGLSLEKRRIGIGGVLLGSILALLLDLAIEPVATAIEHYWTWTSPGPFNYYGVPITNFIAWFCIALILLFLVDLCFVQPRALPSAPGRRGRIRQRLPRLLPGWLFVASLVLFGCVDLTHAFYIGTVCAVCALLAAALCWLLSRRAWPYRR